MINFWKGIVKLSPDNDTWVNTVKVEPNVFQIEGNFSDVTRTAERRFGGFDPQTGLTNTLWGGWQTCWTGVREKTRVSRRKEVTARSKRRRRSGYRENTIERATTTTFQDKFTDRTKIGTSSREGTRQLITEQFDKTSLGERVLNTEITPTIRSRNVTFDGKGFKPQSRIYSFFDGVNVTKYCVPKLLEIEMISGTFSVGETITGTVKTTPNISADRPYIQFRAAVPNHKEGPHDTPTRVYSRNPYTDTQVAELALETYSGATGQVLANAGGATAIVPNTYSSTSTLLNVDIVSLANQPQGDFYGYVQEGMILKGGTSGAEAKITNLRFIVDFASKRVGSANCSE